MSLWGITDKWDHLMISYTDQPDKFGCFEDNITYNSIIECYNITDLIWQTEYEIAGANNFNKKKLIKWYNLFIISKRNKVRTYNNYPMFFL